MKAIIDGSFDGQDVELFYEEASGFIVLYQDLNFKTNNPGISLTAEECRQLYHLLPAFIQMAEEDSDE